MWVGWDTTIDVQTYDPETGETGWTTVFVANAANNNKEFSNVPGFTGKQFLEDVNDTTKPSWVYDNTDYDIIIDNALFLEDTKLPLFRTYHPDHTTDTIYKITYSNDEKAFKNIEDIYGDGNVLSYEVQANDAYSYETNSTAYDDFAFVIVLNYKENEDVSTN